MEMSNRSLQNATSKMEENEILIKRGYYLRGIIGEGSYSKVRRAYSTQIKDDVAIKIIVRNLAPPVFRDKFLPREIQILSYIKHPNIINVYEIFETRRRPVGDTVYIVTEFVKCGDLLEFVKEKGAMPEQEARNVLRDVIEAVTYLHDNDITHRDIKCENILLDILPGRIGMGFTAKLCDFGFARRIPKLSETVRTSAEEVETIPKRSAGISECSSGVSQEVYPAQTQLTKTFCGSAAYAAPEVLERRAHDPRAADIWAMGVVAFITLYGAMPYDDTDINAMVEIQRREEIPASKSRKIARKARDLIKLALKYEPTFRPCAKELLMHQWLQITANKH
uniref:testis-specific serine/threonine-protein kinase 1-like n=1 Tax=Styela clava TaxID=7725 RepID=UPI00193ACCE2|nr:testis-specific serine/threonine-protein kinase 1-like [Styela clava]